MHNEYPHKPKFVAFIPARSGSKRIKDKNLSIINGRSLIQRAIDCAKNIKDISEIILSTDSKVYEDMGLKYGASSYGLRPKSLSNDTSTDKQWLHWLCQKLHQKDNSFTHYLIMRPTSPFRSSNLVKKAIDIFNESSKNEFTTLRTISKTKEHPGKMWVKLSEDRMSRLMPFSKEGIPWSDHSYSSLPQTYIQNACLEIGSIKGILNNMPSSGYTTIPYVCEGIEVFDINTSEDLRYANYLAKNLGL